MIVGINGFGRIGKQVFRILVKNGVQVRLINDPFIDIKYLYYLAKYDTVYGTVENVKLRQDSITTHGVETFLSNKTEPSTIEWKKYKIDYVLECSGKFKTLNELSKHDVKRVIVSCPCEDVPTFLYGINHCNITNEKVISTASCTTNCIAPIAKLLNDNFEIIEGTFTTVHSVTGSQNPVDLKGKNWRLSRSCYNIIPSTTGASKSLELAVPELKGKIKGMAFRVPVEDVSVLDFVVKLKKKTSLYEISNLIENPIEKYHKKILGITFDQVVSSDLIGDPRSSIVDFNASIQIKEDFYKIIAWYDNEYGYSCRMIDLLLHLIKKDEQLDHTRGIDDFNNYYSTVHE